MEKQDDSGVRRLYVTENGGYTKALPFTEEELAKLNALDAAYKILVDKLNAADWPFRIEALPDAYEAVCKKLRLVEAENEQLKARLTAIAKLSKVE